MVGRFFMALLIAVCGLREAHAGALLAPEGQGVAIVTTTFADARKAYDAQGRLIRTPPYRKFEVAGYVEYGAKDWLTLVAEGSAFDFRGVASSPMQSASPGYDGVGLGAFGARVPLGGWGGFSFSLQGELRAAPRAASRFLDVRPPLQVDVRAQAFHNFEALGLPCFLDAQLGYRTRGQNGDEIRVDLTVGARLRPDLLVMAQSFSSFAPWAQAGNGFAAQKFELSGVYDFSRALSLQLGVVAAPTGVNAPAERGIVTGLWARF
jgi:hypothetical protein